ncbi:hypothetical protein [Actinocorallia longicatena]|uniref:Carboxypeptidase regulatory-like domain-containing protein n=1 Tax=Actinocorallia longicatena TaxID=111803 RepID=A0ABP6Q9Z2_9ACTN
MRVLLTAVALLAGAVVAGPAHAAAAQIRDLRAVQGKDGFVAVTGRVVQDGKGVAKAPVGLTYVPKGRPGDSLYVPLTGDSQGRFALRHVLPHDGTWTAAYGTTSRKITSNTRYKTGFSRVKITRKGGRSVVSARLVQYVGSPIENGSWSSLKGRVKISFRKKGSKTFVSRGTFTVKGTFKKTLTGGAGTWRLRYAGGTEWLAVTADTRGTSR